MGIYLPPLYWASRDRTFEEILLVYWKNIDVDDRSRFDMAFPAFARLCSPASDTVVAPLGLAGWRTDELGTAGYVGPYFFRRDADAETDTLFPLFWWVRDQDGATLVAGPWFDVDTHDRHVFGLAPLFLHVEDTAGFFEASLVHLRGNDGQTERGFALQTYWSAGPGDDWAVASAPFYFGGRDVAAQRSWHVVPPLLFGAWSDADSTGLVVGPLVRLQSPRRWDLGVVPFNFGGRDVQHADGFAYDVVPPLLFARWSEQRANHLWLAQTWATWGDDENDPWSVSSIPFAFVGSDGDRHHLVIPPLALASWGDHKSDTTLLGPGFLRSSRSGWDFGIAPLYFGGRETQRADGLSYDVIPPLLLAHWSERGEDRLWLAQTWAEWNAEAWSVTSVPFVFAGADTRAGTHHLVIPPLLLASLGDHKSDTTLLGPGFLRSSRSGWDFGIAPLYFGGRETQRADGLSYDVIPPLLLAHWSERGEDRLWLAQTWAEWNAEAWSVTSVPFVFAGADTRAGTHHLVIPPLLASWGDGTTEHTVLGPWFDIVAPGGRDFGVVPLFVAGDAHAATTDEGKGWGAGLAHLAQGTLQGALGRDSSSTDALHYRLIPPLLYGHVGDGERERTWFAQSWFARTRAGWDLAIAPVYFGGRETQRADGLSYDVIPPLLFAHWSERGEDRLWLAQTWAKWNAAAWSVTSVPFVFTGADTRAGTHHLVILPLLLASFGDGTAEHTVLGPWFDIVAPGGRDLGVVPLFVAGDAHAATTDEGKSWGAGLAHLAQGPLKSALGQHPASTDPLHYRLIPPLLYGHVGDGERERTWFAQSWLARTRVGWDLAIAPVYFGGRETQRADGLSYDVIPPLMFAHWSERGEDRLWLAQTWAEWNAEAWSVASVPFVFAGADTRAGAHHLVIPPLLLASFGDGTAEHTVVGPWFDLAAPGGRDLGLVPLFVTGDAHAATTDEGKSWGAGLAHLAQGPLKSALGQHPASTDPLHYRLIPPLLYGHVGDGEHERTWFAQSWFARTRAGWDLAIAPLYFGGRETQRADGLSYDVIPPLLFARWSERGEDRLWLAQTWAEWNAEAWSVTSVPFVFAGADLRGGTHHLVMPLLLWASWGDSTTEHTVLGPGFDIVAPGGRDFGLVPLFVAGDAHVATTDEGKSWGAGLAHVAQGPLKWALGQYPASTDPLHYRLMPPLLYGHVGDGEHERTWFAQSWFARTRVGWDLAIAPLYFGGRETQRADGLSYDVIPPLLLAHWSERGEDRLWLAQTWAEWNAEAWSVTSVPFVFASADTRAGTWHVLIPPLLFASWADARGGSGLFAGPLFDLERPGGHEQGIIPIFLEGHGHAPDWRLEGHSESWGVGLTALLRPFAQRALGKDEDSTAPLHLRVIPPLLFAHVGDGAHERTWLLQSWLARSPVGWDLGIAPLYFGGRETQRADGLSYDVIPPLLFGRWSDRGEHTLWAAQTWATWSDQAYSIASVPLFFAGDDGRAHHLIFPLLLFGAWGDAWDETLVAGPYLDLKRRRGHDRMLAPIFFEGEMTATDVGPVAARLGLGRTVPFLLEDTTRPAHYRLVPPLYAHFGNGETEQTHLLLAWLRRSSSGVDAGVFPFWAGGFSAREDGPSYQVVPPALFATWSDGKGTRDIIAGPVWWTGRQDGGWSAWALPLYLGGDGDRGARPWYHVVPPLLFATFGDERASTSTTLQLPLYLRHQWAGGLVEAKTPLWWTWETGGDQRTIFAPLLLYGSRADEEDFLIAPLVYRRADASSSDLVVFPFWWDFKGAELDATVVSGLWWDFHWKKDGERLQIAPGYLRWEDSVETLNIAGPVSWTNAKDGAAWSFHVIPFYSAWSFHPDHIRWRVLFGALGYEREREKEQWMVLWLKTPPAQRKKGSAPVR